MAESVAYAAPGSSGALASQIGWINYGAGFILVQNVPVTITNTIPGRYTLTFTLSLTENPNENIGFESVIPPVLPGQSAFGSTGYIGINEPVVLYMNRNADSDLEIFTAIITLSNIVVTDSSGRRIFNYSIVAADAEVTNITEEWTLITNGSPWVKIDTLPAISGDTAQYIIEGNGSNRVSVRTVIISGEGDGNAPASVFSTDSPTEIQAIIKTEVGRQGIAFGIIIRERMPPLFNCICCI